MSDPAVPELFMAVNMALLVMNAILWKVSNHWINKVATLILLFNQVVWLLR